MPKKDIREIAGEFAIDLGKGPMRSKTTTLLAGSGLYEGVKFSVDLSGNGQKENKDKNWNFLDRLRQFCLNNLL